MKKYLMFLVVLFVGSTVFSQNKPVYKVKGDIIKATLYHDNGIIAQTGYYTKDNKLQGEWISYDAQGIKTAVAYYNKGEKVGTWSFYNGDEMKVVDYKNSKITNVQTWQLKDSRVVSN